jgi:transposase
MALYVRPLTDEERTTLARVAYSRTAATREVECARIIWLASQGQRVPAIAAELHLSAKTVCRWLKRFNADGLAGLTDAFRSGRPATYTRGWVAEVIATALSDPQQLHLPFGSWTRDRLEVYLNTEKGIPIKRSRIAEILLAEGLRWRQQETWFGERVDPDFAKKRGVLRRSTPRREKRVPPRHRTRDTARPPSTRVHRQRMATLVLDNLSAHKAVGVQRVLARRGVRLLYLPPYSPDLSPMELCVSKLKTALRAAKARTREALETAICAAMDTVTGLDAYNWFRHCGYAL